jgi:hypothetical protein
MASEVITLTRRDDLQSSNAKFRSRSHDAVIRVYDESGNVIETHEHTVQRVLSSRFSLAPGISLCLARISHPVCDDDHQGIKS